MGISQIIHGTAIHRKGRVQFSCVCVSLERAEMLCAIGHAFFLKHLKKIIFIKHHLLWSWAPPWLISCTGMTHYSFTLGVTFKATGRSSFIMLHTAAGVVLSWQLALCLMLSVWQVVHSVATTLQPCLGFLLPLMANTQSSCWNNVLPLYWVPLM